MTRTLVLYKPVQVARKGVGKPPAGIEDMDFPTMLDKISNHPPTIEALKRVHGPLALRRLFGISALKMRVLLLKLGLKINQHQTIYTWERAERDPNDLPAGYWKHYHLPDKAVEAYHWLLVLFVEWASRGALRATVTGKRVWRVTLRRANGRRVA